MTHIARHRPVRGLVYERDQHHGWAREQLRQLRPPLLTCEAVLTEAAHLVASRGIPQDRVSALVHSGAARIAFCLEEEIGAVHRLLAQYADQPMDFADACPVRMSEQTPSAQILTVDSDFLIYRRFGKEALPEAECG